MRLIDADALIEKTPRLLFMDVNDRIVFETFIENAPTVDIKTEVAEVVRCEGCEHWEATDDGISYNNKGRTDGACEMLWSIHCAERPLTERDHYCGYGRRKTQKEGVGE